MSFLKKIEDFVCENCGKKVKGNGFTNHCPSCLWSKHVDISPGDRKADCKGLMKPVSIDIKKGEYRITHRCISCSYQKINKIEEKDNFEKILKIMKGSYE